MGMTTVMNQVSNAEKYSNNLFPYTVKKSQNNFKTFFPENNNQAHKMSGSMEIALGMPPPASKVSLKHEGIWQGGAVRYGHSQSGGAVRYGTSTPMLQQQQQPHHTQTTLHQCN